jgi:hypothetical protein
MGIASRSPLPPYIGTLIQVTAARMKGQHQFTASDLADIEQTITVEVIRRRARYDASRTLECTFLARLVAHAAHDIIAKRTASNRDYRREHGSLDQWVLDGQGEWVRRSDTIPAGHGRGHLGLSDLSEEELADLAIDLRAAIAGLSRSLRTICRHLMRCDSIPEVARAARVHRSTVYAAIPLIRKAFEQAGLEEYLPPAVPNPTVSEVRR